MSGSNEQECRPITLDGVFKEKCDATQSNSAGASAPLFDILAVQEIISQIFLCHPARGFVEMIAQLANGADMKRLSAFAAASKLQILYHTTTQGCRGIPPFEKKLIMAVGGIPHPILGDKKREWDRKVESDHNNGIGVLAFMYLSPY